MKDIKYALFAAVIFGNTYASLKAVKSYNRFNRTLKNVNYSELRQKVRHLTEGIELRKT